jgi:hypothetical protein
MKITQMKKVLVPVTIALAAIAAGCELIVDFDRTKIPAEDAGQIPVPEGGTGAETGGPATDEGGTDAGPTPEGGSVTDAPADG